VRKSELTREKQRLLWEEQTYGRKRRYFLSVFSGIN